MIKPRRMRLKAHRGQWGRRLGVADPADSAPASIPWTGDLSRQTTAPAQFRQSSTRGMAMANASTVLARPRVAMVGAGFGDRSAAKALASPPST
jgi:hypothetical protein